MNINAGFIPGTSTLFLWLTQEDLGSVVRGEPFSAMLNTTGGVEPVVFTPGTDTHAPGLTLDSSGLLHGTPSTAGTNTFLVRATDANDRYITRTFTIHVTAATSANIQDYTTDFFDVSGSGALDSTQPEFDGVLPLVAGEYVLADGGPDIRAVNGKRFWGMNTYDAGSGTSGIGLNLALSESEPVLLWLGTKLGGRLGTYVRTGGASATPETLTLI